MTTIEASKSRSRALIDGVRDSSWSSRLAVVLVAVLLVLLGVQAVKEPAQFASIGLFAPITGNSGFILKVAGVLIAMAVAMVACGLLGVGIERVAYKPLRNSPRLAVLITAIGMSFILQNLGLVWKGPAQVPFPELISGANILPGESVVFRWKDPFVIA